MLRVIGAALGAVGVALAALDLIAAGRLRALGEWWFMLAPTSLQLLQPAVERHVARWLWDPVILGALQVPAAAFPVVLGAVLLAIGLLRRRKIEI